MENGLAGGFVDVYADVITIRVEALVYLLFDVLQHYIHGLALMIGEVEVRGHMPFGYDQCVTGRNRVAVIECDTGSRFADDFHPARQTTKWAFLAFNSWEFVEMVILVEFVTFVGHKTLKWQFDITLIGVLLMNRVDPKTFFN